LWFFFQVKDGFIPIGMIEILSALTAWLHVECVHFGGYPLPNGYYHVAFLPGVDVCRGFREPVAKVLALGAWHTKLEGAVRDEYPE
jgi:hypothetical protein